MAKILKCDGCNKDLEPTDNVAGAKKVQIRRRLSSREIAVVISAHIIGAEEPGELCLPCLQKIVREHTHRTRGEGFQCAG